MVLQNNWLHVLQSALHAEKPYSLEVCHTPDKQIYSPYIRIALFFSKAANGKLRLHFY